MKNKIPIFRADDVMFIASNDKRHKNFKKQIKERGFADSELWSLDYSIFCFILPRLKEFAKNSGGYPGYYKNKKEWKKDLDKMVKSIEYIVENESSHFPLEQLEKGYDLFLNNLRALWT